MAEELVKIMERFALITKEMQEVEIIHADLKKGIKECQNILIGKIIGERKANFSGVRRFAESSWGNPKKMRVAEIGANLFQFNFEQGLNKEKILHGGPWIFDNQLLVLRQWVEGIEDDEKAFSNASFWIQVWNIPLHWFSKEIGIKIGARFEEVNEVILPHTRSRDGKHMKMLVEMDSSQLILRGTSVRYNGYARWIKFKYEKIQDFYYNCGIIGHGDNSYFNRRKMDGRKNGQQYGDWLRIKINKGGGISGKSKVNHDYFQEFKNNRLKKDGGKVREERIQRDEGMENREKTMEGKYHAIVAVTERMEKIDEIEIEGENSKTLECGGKEKKNNYPIVFDPTIEVAGKNQQDMRKGNRNHWTIGMR